MDVDLQLARPNNANQELITNGEFEIVNGQNGMEIQAYTPPQQQTRGIPDPPSNESMGRFTVNVPQQSGGVNNYTQPTITTNGIYTIPNGYTGFNDFEVDVPQQSSVNNFTQPTITTNGTYTIPSGYTGFNDFTVSVPPSTPTIYSLELADYTVNTNQMNHKSSGTAQVTLTIPNGYAAVVIYIFNNYYGVNFNFNKSGNDGIATIGRNTEAIYYLTPNATTYASLVLRFYDNQSNEILRLKSPNGLDPTYDYTQIYLYKPYFSINL